MIYCSRQRLVELLCTYFYLVVQIRHKGYPKRLMSYLRGICLGHVLKYLFLSSQLYNKHRGIVVQYAVLVRTNSCLSGRLIFIRGTTSVIKNFNTHEEEADKWDRFKDDLKDSEEDQDTPQLLQVTKTFKFFLHLVRANSFLGGKVYFRVVGELTRYKI